MIALNAVIPDFMRLSRMDIPSCGNVNVAWRSVNG